MRHRIAQAHMPLPLTQFEALRFIDEHPGASMREVAAHLHITAPSATATIQALVADAYIARTAHAQDRRSITLHTTPKGARAVGTAVAERKKILAEVLSPLSAQDHAALSRILTTILTAQTI